MAITTSKTGFVSSSSQTIGLAQMFSVTASSSNPAYLVLSALDRNEYTPKATGAVGALSGNGHILSLSSIGGDGRGAGIVFTYQAANGRYYNATYGYLDQLTYISSVSFGDIASLSLFSTTNLSQANNYASNTYAMMQIAPTGYLGSVTVATEPGFTATVPAQATPNSIASLATSFVGQAWNMNGCWVLASTIAAEAGASLPVQTSAIGVVGRASGEWIVAFNGPAGQSGDWQSLVHAGEMIVIGTPGGGGHITTCVSGSGSSAMLVDNISYLNSQEKVTNLANDGSGADVIIAVPHAASQEWSGVSASSVVIYQLDTPVVSTTVASADLACLASQSLASLFAVSDPINRAITSWQAYDTAASDSLLLNGTCYSAHSAGSAVIAASLSSLALLAGATATIDTLEVRAFNGLYWGDWQALTVSVTAPKLVAPLVALPTPNQTWLGGKAFTLTLPAGTFADPQHQTLRYNATLSNGQALPSWLSYNPTTDAFSGTAPLTAQSLSLKVTATDTSGLSTSETFTATIVGAPTLAAQTAGQTWQECRPISFALPANTFTDPQGQMLNYTASQSNGQALPSWLTFNPSGQTFIGTAPATLQSLSIKVTATDTSGLAASETFAANVTAPVIKPAITVSAQTAPQTWTDGQTVDLVLPAKTFTDALGLKMTFAAYQVSGPNITSWLHFNAAIGEFTGKVPVNASGTAWLAVVASDAQQVSATDLFPVTMIAGSVHAAVGSVASVGMMPNIDQARLATMLLFHS